MNINEYQEEVKKTAIYPNQNSFEGLKYVALGLTEESGEIAGKIKKCIRDSNSILSTENRALLLKEGGDVLWYLSQFCVELGITLEELAQVNIDKIRDRQARNVVRGSGDTR